MYRKPDRIDEGLYLGSLNSASNREALLELGIKSIVTVANDTGAPPFPDTFSYTLVHVADAMHVDLTSHFEGCFVAIEEGRKAGGVLVHCLAGMSRSATIVIAYMMKSKGKKMATTPRDMELRLVNGMVLKVQLEEMAGGVGERVAAFEAKLREQSEAMAALKRDMAEMRSAMAHLKGMAATGALAEKNERGEAGNGSASGEAAEGIGAQPLKGARGNSFSALEVEEVKAQVEAARGEARTAAHTEARINDVELALVALKERDGRAEKNRDERKEGTAGEHAVAERRGEKRRKRDDADAGKEEEMADAPSVVRPLIALGGTTHLDLDGVYLSDDALTQVASLRSLTCLSLQDASGFTAVGVTRLFSLTGLTRLEFHGTSIPDAALEGIAGLTNLRLLDLVNAKITDAGVAKLQGLSALTTLLLGECASITSASMVHVGRLTSLERLILYRCGVREDGLQHLTALSSLKAFTLPPGVTDSGMKHLRNLKRLDRLGLWDAKISAEGIKWLKGLKFLQKIATDSEDVAVLIRDIFPGMIVTSGPI
ncbi:unnamed protein product [Closterium sp. Yama58-4]|nr:unnamed protein product [Closterium sp. Yama58-4]